MKLFKSIIPALLAVVAVGFTACSDDDDYVVGQQSPGAYFSDKLPATVAIPLDGSSFDITVNRTSADDPATYTLTSTDESGLFNIPSSVTFTGSELTAPVTITFDPSKVEFDTPYPITLKLESATAYGKETYSFNAIKANPMEVEELGDAIYTYNGIWKGQDVQPISKTWNPSKPNCITYLMENWGGGATLNVVVPDMSAVNADGLTEALVPCQFTGYVHAEYGPVWVADYYSYWKDYRHDPDAEQVRGSSYYNTERGLFNLHVVYYVPEYGNGNSSFGDFDETLQLPGYPDYSISVTYNGTLIRPDGSYEANATVSPAADVASFKTACVQGNDAQAAVNAILSGAEGVQEFEGNEPQSVYFPLTAGGNYVIAAVSYDAGGNPIQADAASFQLQIGEKPYTEVGTCQYADGFIAPGFGVVDEAYNVTLLKDKSVENLYYLDSPFTNQGFPIYANNENSVPVQVSFDVSDPTFVLVPQQQSGFTDTKNFGGAVEIGNNEGALVANNPGVSIADIKAFMASKGITDFSTYEDGVVTIHNCLFSQNGEFGYNWKSKAPGYIFFPEATQAARRLAKIKAVAAPRHGDILSRVARAQMTDIKHVRISGKTLKANLKATGIHK